jgi:cytochrome c5
MPERCCQIDARRAVRGGETLAFLDASHLVPPKSRSLNYSDVMARHACLLALTLLAAASADARAQNARTALGEKVFITDCRTCHDNGKAQNDAPQLSEKSEWKDRLGKGLPELYTYATTTGIALIRASRAWRPSVAWLSPETIS